MNTNNTHPHKPTPEMVRYMLGRFKSVRLISMHTDAGMIDIQHPSAAYFGPILNAADCGLMSNTIGMNLQYIAERPSTEADISQVLVNGNADMAALSIRNGKKVAEATSKPLMVHEGLQITEQYWDAVVAPTDNPSS
jgi:hypothetical protein